MLQLRLFGGLAVELDGTPVDLPSSRRAWALLGWLALQPGLHQRSAVAARFWPDVLDSSARASLRSATWSLRNALGDAGDRYLHASRDRLGLLPDAGLWVDAVAFGELAAAGRLAEAAALSRGDLLAGLDDEWVLEAREAHRAKLTDVLEGLAAAAQDQGDLATALDWSRKQAALNPFAEEPVRRLMDRLVATGDRAAALAVYTRFADRLERELGVTPSGLTRGRARELREAPGPGPEPRPSPGYQRATGLVGRQQELDRLLAAWDAARGGSGAVVTISGEPGIGKTRLAIELLERARAQGARTASCQALDLGGAAPLGLWAELIGEASRDLDAPPLDAAWPTVLTPLAPDLEHRLGRRPGRRPGAAPDLERARLFEATVGLLEWASRRPMVLLLEDMHAADTASLELAGYVGRRVPGMRVLMVLTRRPLPRRPAVDAVEHALRARGALVCEVALAALPAADVAQLARAVGSLSDQQAAEVVAAAAGNALIAVEWARALSRGEHEPPASLRGAVRSALAPIPPDSMLLAELIAVAGRELDQAEIDALPVGTPEAAAVAALDTGLLIASRGRIGYRHALLREAVCSDLAEPHRAGLHYLLAVALAGRTDPAAPRFAAEAARHFRLAGRDDLALEQLIRAAAHARAVAALPEAAAFLTEAIELAPGDAGLLIELAETQAWCGRFDSCEDAFSQALVLLAGGSAEPLARAWARRANWFRGPICHPRRVLESARRALELLNAAGANDPAERAELLAAQAWAEAVAGDADTCDQLLEQVHTVLGGRPGGDLVTHWVGHARAFALIRRGRFTDSYAPQIAAGEAAQRAGRPDLGYGSWCSAACAAAGAGDFDRALQFIDRGMTALSGSGLTPLEMQYQAARGYVLTRLGRPAEAIAAADAEGDLADRLGHPELLATGEYDCGQIALACGDYAQAARFLAAALNHDTPQSRPLGRFALAEALVRLGRCDEAQEQLRAAVLEPVRAGDRPETLVPRLARLQGLIAAGRGDQELAVRRLTEAADGWRRLLSRADAGDDYVAIMTDFGRPPVAGLVEPARELDRVLADLRALPETVR